LPSLAEFVGRTSAISLDAWQRHLCGQLERLRTETGLRIAIHAPPQLGKSVIVSQRLPSWLMGVQPAGRVKLACYNITQATRHGKVAKEILLSGEYAAMFPQADRRIPERVSAEEFSNQARLALMDAQPSFKALGLVTGFVGQGADTLIIDDPYASPQDAMSEVVRASTWMFWDDSARVRLNEKTNVVVMFHRYHEADLAGKLFSEEGLKEEGGQWEVLRYAAQADDEPHLMPPGRQLGEYLSPRYSEAWYKGQESKGLIWLSQFQGRPTSKEGLFFQPDKIGVVDQLPTGISWCRAWDLAATEGAGDWTVGALLGMDKEGRVYIADLIRGQWGPDRVDNAVMKAPDSDPKATMNHLAQDPGSAGKRTAHGLAKDLKEKGCRAMYEQITGAKESRAWDFAKAVNSGLVNMVRAPWNTVLREELRGFPLGTHDDQVDATSDAYNFLEAMRPKGDHTSRRGTSGGYV
jgi:predicted phage terminase large subunit-like protein